MVLPKIVQTMMGQANVSGERSTVLHAVLWLIGIICGLFSVIALTGLDKIFLYIILIIFVISLMFFGYIYLYCLKNDPDLLRSEKFALQKMTIQNSVQGDSDIGVIESPKNNNNKLISNITNNEANGTQEGSNE
ncbi:hypothetical protein L9D01_000198 [Klebsiella aerogenes]|nr:hypothetical protein [Klebsiella aerogenes]